MRITLLVSMQMQYWQEVEADLVFDVAPHLVGTFAVHRDVYHPSKWRLSHVETGAMAGPLGRNRFVAIREGRKYLAEKEPKQFDKAIRDLVKRAPFVQH